MGTWWRSSSRVWSGDHLESSIPVNGSNKTLLKATVERRYKDKDGSWKSTASFGRAEIPLVADCLSKAFEAIVSEETAQNGSASENITDE